MMFGTVMISNTSSSQSSNPQHKNEYKMNNQTLLTTATSLSSNHSLNTNNQHHVSTISHLISNKYQQQQDMSDTDISERTNSIYRNSTKSRSNNLTQFNNQNRPNWQKGANHESFDQLSISSQTTKISSNTQKQSIYQSRNTEPPLPALPPPQNPQLSKKNLLNQMPVDLDQVDSNAVGIYDKIRDDRIEAKHRRNDNQKEDENEKNIQVQILPMDENWGENNTTAHTADFSDFNDDMTEDGRSSHFNFNPNKFDSTEPLNQIGCLTSAYIWFKKYFGLICAFSMSFCSFLTPIFFIALPRLGINQWQINDCGLECEGILIGIAFKLFILLLGNWAVFVRRPKTALPRIYELRALLVFFLCIMTFSYWLFYLVRILETQIQDYYKILQFTVSYVDVLLFVFIISVFVLELRHLQPQYVVNIVRSPDGQHEQYTIGDMSIQRAAVWILENYYKDFKVFNPWLENAHRKRAAQLMQLEQVNNRTKGRGKNENTDDNMGDNTETESSRNYGKRGSKNSKKLNSSKFNGSMVTLNMNANDRLYEEYEFDRRLKKRRARLLTTTEEAFSHVRRIQNDTISNSQSELNEAQKSVMDPFEAAQAVFTSIARDLRRYLRITRQQPYFTRDSIVAHLANCISYDMTPKSFLQRYLDGEPLVFNDRALSLNHQRNKLNQNCLESRGINYNVNLKTLDQSWILISDSALYQSVEDNLMFVLKQNEVTLMCTFKRLPRFSLFEDILDPKRNKFTLKLNSETTV